MSAWALKLETSGTGLRVAVKDLIDMVGLPTTVGSRVVAERAAPAERDATCLAGIRAAEAAGEARIVGKTTLHELAFGITGINAWAGTPRNPIAPDRVPGGSSSGSAVVVAAGEADVALGSDTGGSIRIPSACCGIAGLKTTNGRVSLDGVFPLAPSLDSVGPMAADVAGLVRGMALLEPGFAIGIPRPVRIGRVRLPADPVVDRAVDRALRASELEVVELRLPGWEEASTAALTLLNAEAWASDRHLVEAHADEIGADVRQRLVDGGKLLPSELVAARRQAEHWRSSLAELLLDVDVIALPTLLGCPPRLEDASDMWKIRGLTAPVNLAGLPALALPVPADEQPVPPSIQLIGPHDSERTLLETGAMIEAGVQAG
jgi:amidase